MKLVERWTLFKPTRIHLILLTRFLKFVTYVGLGDVSIGVVFLCGTSEVVSALRGYDISIAHVHVDSV